MKFKYTLEVYVDSMNSDPYSINVNNELYFNKGDRFSLSCPLSYNMPPYDVPNDELESYYINEITHIVYSHNSSNFSHKVMLLLKKKTKEEKRDDSIIDIIETV